MLGSYYHRHPLDKAVMEYLILAGLVYFVSFEPGRWWCLWIHWVVLNEFQLLQLVWRHMPLVQMEKPLNESQTLEQHWVRYQTILSADQPCNVIPRRNSVANVFLLGFFETVKGFDNVESQKLLDEELGLVLIACTTLQSHNEEGNTLGEA